LRTIDTGTVQYVTRTEIAGEGFEAVDIDLELVAASRRRDIDGGECRLVDHSIYAQTVTRLEAPHRLVQIRIIDVIVDRARIRVEISGDG
jgi:hypothetical protein